MHVLFQLLERQNEPNFGFVKHSVRHFFYVLLQPGLGCRIKLHSKQVRQCRIAPLPPNYPPRPRLPRLQHSNLP